MNNFDIIELQRNNRIITLNILSFITEYIFCVFGLISLLIISFVEIYVPLFNYKCLTQNYISNNVLHNLFISSSFILFLLLFFYLFISFIINENNYNKINIIIKNINNSVVIMESIYTFLQNIIYWKYNNIYCDNNIIFLIKFILILKVIIIIMYIFLYKLNSYLYRLSS
jgi:hypothetical protein